MTKVKEKSEKLGCTRKEKCSGSEAAGARQGSRRGVAPSKLVAAFSFKLLCFLRATLCFQRPFLSSGCQVLCTTITETCMIKASSTHASGLPLQKLWQGPQKPIKTANAQNWFLHHLNLARCWYLSLTVSTKGHILLVIRNMLWYSHVIGGKDYVCFISSSSQISPNYGTIHIYSSSLKKPRENTFPTGCCALTCPKEWTL